MTQPAQTWKIARWIVPLSFLHMECVPQRAIKGQAIADFLAQNPFGFTVQISDELPNDSIFFAIPCVWEDMYGYGMLMEQ